MRNSTIRFSEKKICFQIQEALQTGQPVISDITHAKSEWRKSLRNPVRHDSVQWIVWHLQTLLSLCQTWAQQRIRQVPEFILRDFFRSLQEFPPSETEGFVIVNSVCMTEQGF